MTHFFHSYSFSKITWLSRMERPRMEKVLKIVSSPNIHRFRWYSWHIQIQMSPIFPKFSVQLKFWHFFFMNTSPICANFIFLKTFDPFQMSQIQSIMTMSSLLIKLKVEVESDLWVRNCPMALRSNSMTLRRSTSMASDTSSWPERSSSTVLYY